MVSCPGCGNGMRFDPKRQMLYCDACTGTLTPEQAMMGSQSTLQNNSGYVDGNVPGTQNDFVGTLYTCPSCGAEMFTDSDSAVTFCSYCGASVELQGQLVRMQAPSAVIPFKKTNEEISAAYTKLIKSALYAPSYMYQKAQVEKIRGIYMPFWVYEYQYQGPASFSGSKSYRRGDYIITDRYSLTTNLNVYYNGVAFDASSTFSDVYSEAIVPYKVDESVNFNSAYLCGYYADTADVYASVYEVQAKEAISKDVTSMLMKECPEFRSHGVNTGDAAVKNLLTPKSKKIAYFPVYFLANRRNGYVSYAVVNGQTGKIAADIPIDFGKYIIGSILLALPIMLIFDLLFTPSPMVVAVTAVIFAIISYCISNGELNLVYTREKGADDLGLLFKRNQLPDGQSQSTPVNSSGVKVKVSNTLGTIAGFMIFTSIMGFFVAVDVGAAEIALFSVADFFIGCILAVVSSSGNKKAVAAEDKNIVIKRPFKEKIGVLWKPILAIVLGIIVIIANPFMDIVYYGAAIAIIVLVIISFYDVVKLHNQLTRHLPHQFNKRGGDM